MMGKFGGGILGAAGGVGREVHNPAKDENVTRLIVCEIDQTIGFETVNLRINKRLTFFIVLPPY